MALIGSRDYRKLEIPHEPGQWVTVRPVGAGDLELLEARDGNIRVSLELLAAVIIEWSYDQPPHLEVLKSLDLDTYVWVTEVLGEELLKLSGVRSDDEKKSSPGSSSSTTSPPAPGVEPSPESSGTS